MSNQRMIVSDDEVERALDWLRDSAQEIGNAKANAVRAGHMIKHVKALVMRVHDGKPASHQEREALASPEYLQAIEEDAMAAGELMKLQALREAAALKIEAWRSSSANFRAMRI